MSFENLLSELQQMSAEQETLSKALPTVEGKDDEKIRAAAAEAGDGEGKDDKDGKDGKGGKDCGDGEQMGKSLGTVTLESGEQVDAIDGTELVKSLLTRVETTEGQVQKALEGAVSLIKSQGAMIKSLSEQVGKLADTGRGRKTVLTVTEKKSVGETTLVKSESGMTPVEFMAKSNAAFTAGKITGKDLTVIDVCLREGHTVDAGLISKVMS